MTLQKRLTDCIARAVEAQEVAGASVLVLRHGHEVVYAESGMADMETSRPFTRDAIGRMYSLTKPVTATAAMVLVERGQLDLCQPVADFLPGFRDQQVWTPQGLTPVQRPVTPMDLLGMTAGLCYPGEDPAGRAASGLFAQLQEAVQAGEGIPTVELCNRMGELPLAFQPGSHFRYGTCADVLGAVIEVVSGKPLAEFMQQELFDPLGMKDTAFWVPESKRGRMPRIYQHPGALIPYDRINLGVGDYSHAPAFASGGAGLVSTLDDYAALATMIYQHPGALIPYDRINLGVGDYSHAPAFASGGAGLVSTLDDYAALATMLLQGGRCVSGQLLQPETVAFLTSAQLGPQPQADVWNSLDGFSYGKLMRVMQQPGRYPGLSRMGEYGWDGWLGCYFANFPQEDMTILMMAQRTDLGTGPLTRRLRNLILSSEEARD